MRVAACVTAAIVIVVAASVPAGAAQFYTVAPHDTLYSIARHFGVPLNLLATINGIRDPSKIRIGMVLRIPDVSSSRRGAPASHTAPHPAAVTATPQSGPPRVSTEHAAPGVTPGSSLPARTQAPAVPRPPRITYYVVRSGDTLYRIAQAYGLTVPQLQQANHLASPDVLLAGRVLRIPLPPAGALAVGGATQARLPVQERISSPPPVLLGPERTGLLARRVTSEALGYLGTPYVWGGMSRAGVDCSGLVYLVYSAYVPDLPRISYDQWHTGVPVGRSDLAPGDLVFFNTDGTGASHVGIYLGDGRFVHPSATPRQVVIDYLDSPYYAEHYLGARRVL